MASLTIVPTRLTIVPTRLIPSHACRFAMAICSDTVYYLVKGGTTSSIATAALLLANVCFKCEESFQGGEETVRRGTRKLSIDSWCSLV